MLCILLSYSQNLIPQIMIIFINQSPSLRNNKARGTVRPTIIPRSSIVLLKWAPISFYGGGCANVVSLVVLLWWLLFSNESDEWWWWWLWPSSPSPKTSGSIWIVATYRKEPAEIRRRIPTQNMSCFSVVETCKQYSEK